MSLELLIIGLHKVGNASPEAKIKGLFIDPKQLEFCLLLIREMGFEFATLRDAIGKKNGKFAVITFDDGYADNLKNGFPILQKMKIPATVFVITDDVGKSEVAWSEAADDLPADLLTWEQLKYLQNEGWEIGSHSCRHIHLSRYPVAEQEESILLSIEEIRHNLGIEPISFAYPYGDYQPATKNILKSCGIKYAVTIKQATSLRFSETTDCFELQRVSLGGGKRRHYIRNLSRLAKATGTGAVIKGLIKTIQTKLISSADKTDLVAQCRKENS